MDKYIDFLKGQVNVLNTIIVAAALVWVLNYYGKKRVAKILFVVTLIFFALASTGFLPQLWISKLESQYSPLNASPFDSATLVYIVVLGGGYTDDPTIPAIDRLSDASKGRLLEGLRWHRQIENSTLVFSGYQASGETSLAMTMKLAADELGGLRQAELLEDTHNTMEEGREMAGKFGTDIPVILVTDARHMARALSSFRKFGITPTPAPTNFQIKKSDHDLNVAWMPSIDNVRLTDQCIREALSSFKAMLN